MKANGYSALYRWNHFVSGNDKYPIYSDTGQTQEVDLATGVGYYLLSGERADGYMIESDDELYNHIGQILYNRLATNTLSTVHSSFWVSRQPWLSSHI